MVFLLQWSIPRLLRSLGHSSLGKTQPKDFFLVCSFCFVSSKFKLPGVMISCDRASSKRKKSKNSRIRDSAYDLLGYLVSSQQNVLRKPILITLIDFLGAKQDEKNMLYFITFNSDYAQKRTVTFRRQDDAVAILHESALLTKKPLEVLQYKK